MNGDNGILAASGNEDLGISVASDRDGGARARGFPGIPADDVTVGAGGHARLQGHRHVRTLRI